LRRNNHLTLRSTVSVTMSTPGFWKPAPTATSSLQGQLREESRNDEDWAPVFSRSSASAPLAQQMLLLPIYKHRRQIIYALEDYGVVIVVGETGSGKSTQIPQYLVESGWAENDFQIVCTQPRRIAAITLAQRVAEEAGTDLGNGVGYSVRFDDQSSPNTQIKYVTDGMLLRWWCLLSIIPSSWSTNTFRGLIAMVRLIKIRRKRKIFR
jgi:ATP-dependent RNA helicase DDX35